MKIYTQHEIIELSQVHSAVFEKLEALKQEIKENTLDPNSPEAEQFAIDLALWDGGGVWEVFPFPPEDEWNQFLATTATMSDPAEWEGMEEFPREKCGEVIGATGNALLYKLPTGKYVWSEIPE